MRNVYQLAMSLPFLMSAPALVVAAPQGGDYYGPRMMMWDGMFFAPVMMIVFLAIAVAVVVLIVRWLIHYG